MTDIVPPIPMRYTGESWVPLTPHWQRVADKHYAIGEIRNLVPEEQRSRASHGHQFAEIGDAWRTLPEHLAERFPTAEALRKFALIKAGFATVTEHVCGSQAEAQRLASVIAGLDPYSVTEVRRNVVRHLRAMSQSLRAMGREDFQRSKQGCLEVVADLIGVPASTLSANVGRAA